MNNFIKFLKPNKKKVILFLLLLCLISVFAHHFSYKPPTEPLSSEQQEELIPISNPTGCYPEKLNILFLPTIYIPACGQPDFLWILHFWIIIPYFISCSIFYLHEKFKPKKILK